ncbi:hypothetical protein J32TS6_25650 [Virgibacillus pantothenticus]|uniref:TIGR03986 family type III CRISPR-associated RAMP protein n=1 Tax=Virgibacillus pantothenticus TaxID=1473 RepID=UPI001B0E1A0F|nr:TIGR03986 family CRISPR-associated RAMP protein [Virgibacillus pantothenticus]GIP64010.1 hypothetical protein J32TS6_25650 [Virgibacillus pantothenticus]
MRNKQQNERFVNPYNFVPLESKCDKKGNQKVGSLTGKIECTLETLTPVFIPDSKDKEAFFHYPEDEKPVIPGSEIRGTIRSVFEAAFNGCLSQVNEGSFHRRSMDAKHPGLLFKTDEGWKLIQCGKIIKTTPYDIEPKSIILSEGDTLYSKNNRIFYKKQIPDGKEGFVHLSEKGPNGKPIFVFQPLRKTYKIEEIEIEYLLKVLELYERNNDKNEEHSGYIQYKHKLRSMLMCTDRSIKLPVYYSTDVNENISHLAPAALSQEVFKNTLVDILKAQGEYQPCECKQAICPACHLFGFVNQQEMQASRIRFSDATIQKDCTFLDKMTLPALGEPKPGAVEFYTEKPKNNSYWTYDYDYIQEKRRPLKPSEVKIRGRKFYWHHEPKHYPLKTTDKEEMETTISPLDKGNRFNFTVYFERLTEKELNQLCNVLDINDSKEHAHKIGRGKPLGFGSIRITIDSIQTRKINENTGAYDLKTDQQRKNIAEAQINQASDLLRILRYQPGFAKNTVTYPKVEKSSQEGRPNDLASHQWFNKNKTRNGFKKVLPTIEEEVSTKSHKWLKINKV